MAGGGTLPPIPGWGVLYTFAIYIGMLVAKGTMLFGGTFAALASCGDVVSCTASAFDVLGSIGDFLSLGGLSGFLPLWLLGIHLLVMGIAYGPTLFTMIANAIGAVVP